MRDSRLALCFGLFVLASLIGVLANVLTHLPQGAASKVKATENMTRTASVTDAEAMVAVTTPMTATTALSAIQGKAAAFARDFKSDSDDGDKNTDDATLMVRDVAPTSKTVTPQSVKKSGEEKETPHMGMFSGFTIFWLGVMGFLVLMYFVNVWSSF
ncbi:hypothetical protein B0H66DRAFT_626146 [Apodospora peruviana]|uniref:Uncharacterized protein n=1 Tax=Apodospora peruviana TaxID=516989 RepID=A0AAE0M2K4_9PEZI|nr:hypothetical protein B0H66DRAFT_626146 [Apodospora peruviana]